MPQSSLIYPTTNITIIRMDFMTGWTCSPPYCWSKILVVMSSSPCAIRRDSARTWTIWGTRWITSLLILCWIAFRGFSQCQCRGRSVPRNYWSQFRCKYGEWAQKHVGEAHTHSILSACVTNFTYPFAAFSSPLCARIPSTKGSKSYRRTIVPISWQSLRVSSWGECSTVCFLTDLDIGLTAYSQLSFEPTIAAIRSSSTKSGSIPWGQLFFDHSTAI